MVKTREEGQLQVVEALKKYKSLLVLYPTGFGKAKAALDAVKNIPAKRALIIVHSENARDITWPIEINKWAPTLTGMNLYICCYQSLKTLGEDHHYDWIIADEAHYITPNYMSFFINNNFDNIILMTGTLPEDQIKRSILKNLSQGNKIEIKLDEATNAGILNDYTLSVWYVEMTPLEKSAYLTHCAAVQRAFLTRNDNFINMKLGERMRFIYNLNTKVKAGIYLRDQIRATGKKNIIFCGSIETADQLSPYRYHSKVTDTDYRRFLNNEIKELASIKQIQEGSNIDNLESALVVQLNSKQLNLLQKLGRLMRLEVGKIARMHVLIVKDTMDENWLHKATKSIDPAKIKHYKLDRELFDPQIT